MTYTPEDAGAYNWDQFANWMKVNVHEFEFDKPHTWKIWWLCWKEAYRCSENLI